MNQQEKVLPPIDNNTYQLNILYQLRLVELNRSQLYKDDEKKKIKALLTCCKHLDGNKLRTVINRIFTQSVQLNQETNNVVITGANTNSVNDCDTDTNPEAEIAEPIAELNSINQQSHEPEIRRVTVNIRRLRGTTKPKDTSLCKEPLKKMVRKRKRLWAIRKKSKKILIQDDSNKV